MKKRLATLLLALCTLLSLLPASALAKDPGGGGFATRTQTATVYVYTQIEGMTDDELKDLTLNAHGWYTLGYVEVTYTGKLTLEKVKAAMAKGFVHEYNTSIRISDVVFDSLKISDGADDYVAAGTPAYHLDGKLTVKAQYGFVTIKHEGTDGASLLTEQSVPYRAGTTLTFGRDYNSHSFNGYTYDHNSDSNYTVVADQNKVITLYYQPVTGLSYSVNYLEQGSNRVLHNAKTVDGVTHGRTYSESAVSIPGYKLVGSASRSVTVSDGGDNVITFYYEKDAAQTQDVSYEVRYTVAGVLRSEETVTVTDHIWVNDPAEIAIVDGGIPAPADKFPGYVLDSENPAYPAAGTKVASGTVFTVNYVPRTDLSYTVRYLEQDTNKVLHEEKTVQNQTFGATVTEEPVQITGYVTPSEQELTIGLENNVITFYYQRDNGQTKSLSYTVQYYKDGQLQENDTLRFTANVWVNAPDTIVIQNGSVFTDANKYPGYVLSATSDRYATGDPVASGSVFKVYYTARTDLSYTVRYLEQGTDKVLHEEKTVQNQTFGATVTEEPVQIAGYVTPSEQELTIGLENNVITFYYEKDAAQTQDVSYEVRYTVAGVLRSEETVTVSDRIWVNDPAEIAIVDGGIPAPADKFPGYVLDSENPAYPAAGTKVASGTVFTVNYVPRTDLSYTVRYLEQGTNKVLHEEKTVQNQTFGAVVTESPIVIDGYAPTETSSVELRIGTEKNEITFYYTAIPATPADPAAPVTPVPPVTPDSPAAPVTPTAPDSTPESPATPVSPADTIQPATEEIIDDETPLAGPAGGAWALLNLILTAVTVALSAALLVGYLGKSKQAREDENGNTVYDENGSEVLEYIRKKRGFWRVVSLIPAIGAVIAFILTENMLLPMVIVDRWTLLMVAIALVQVVITALSKKRDEEQEENDSAAC